MTSRLHKHRILILGGGYAGLMAAARSARIGSAADITLVNAAPQFVQRIRLHEALAGAQPRQLTLAPFLAKRGVHFVQGFVEALEPERERILGRTSAGTPLELGYDQLIIALGSRTSAPSPDVAAHTLRLNDVTEVHMASSQIQHIARRGGRVLVIGGGLTGIETATELAERFPTLRVSLITSGRLGDGYAVDGAAHLQRRFAQLSIDVREHTPIIGVEQGRAWSADGTALPFDMCVWCGGFEAPQLLREAGLQVDRHGRIVVDAMLRAVDHPNLFAVGDAAQVSVNGRAIRMGCVSALPMGAHVGNNLYRLYRGEELKPFSMAFALRCISLGRQDALVQWTHPDDIPRAKIWAQRPAVLVKELICRMTLAVVAGELRFGLPLYHWPHASGGASETDLSTSSTRA